jgi:peptidoglycan/LPS O-acetylase OafA/YrhL
MYPNLKPMRKKLNYLEGLRGVAALIVVFHHLGYTFSVKFAYQLLDFLKVHTHSSTISYLVHYLVSFMLDGKLAVYIFWFMSGYVISIKLFTTNNDNYLVGGFVKRYFRLAFPALGSVLFAFILFYFGMMYNNELAEVFGKGYKNGWLGSFYDFTPNFLLAIKSGLWDTFFAFNRTSSYNEVLWTMNPELYGSIFCFFLYAIIRNNKYRHGIYLVITLGSFLLGNYWVTSFLLGFLLCDVEYNSSYTPKFLANALSTLFQYKYLNLALFMGLILVGGMPNYYGYFDLIISSLIVIIIMKTQVLQTFFEHKVIVYLGKISFSLYLVHLPIICSFTCFLYLKLPMSHLPKVLIVSAMTIIVSIIVAHFFTNHIDGNGVRLSNRFAQFVLDKQNEKTM